MTLFALFACASPADSAPPDTAAPLDEAPDLPTAYYAVEVADTWEGDCALADDATYQPAEQQWLVDPRGDVLVIFPDFWSVLSCAYDGEAFSCDNGSWQESRMQVTRLLEGTLDAAGTLDGAFVVELDCSGAGCDTLQDTYGNRLDFPCRVEAPVAGVRIE